MDELIEILMQGTPPPATDTARSRMRGLGPDRFDSENIGADNDEPPPPPGEGDDDGGDSGNIIVAVVDWNYEDKIYEAPIKLVKEFLNKVIKEGAEKAWDWWVDQVEYPGDSRNAGAPIKCLGASNAIEPEEEDEEGGEWEQLMDSAEVGWDYNDPIASAEEALEELG